MLGFGSSQVTLLPADEEGRLTAEALEVALQQDPSAPTVVLLQAGDIDIGAYDSFETLIPIAHGYNAWVASVLGPVQNRER